jgi:hypothetical protein
MGDVRVGRFLGVDDGFGTRVVGDLIADDMVGYRNHHLSLFGTLSCTTYVDDEDDGDDAVADVLAKWGGHQVTTPTSRLRSRYFAADANCPARVVARISLSCVGALDGLKEVGTMVRTTVMCSHPVARAPRI